MNQTQEKDLAIKRIQARYGNIIKLVNRAFDNSIYNDFIWDKSSRINPVESLAIERMTLERRGIPFSEIKIKPFNRIQYATVQNHYNFLISSLLYYGFKLGCLYNVELTTYSLIEQRYFGEKKNETESSTDVMMAKPEVLFLIIEKSAPIKRDGYSDHIINKYISEGLSSGKSVFVSSEYDASFLKTNFPRMCETMSNSKFAYFRTTVFYSSPLPKNERPDPKFVCSFGRYPDDVPDQACSILTGKQFSSATSSYGQNSVQNTQQHSGVRPG